MLDDTGELGDYTPKFPEWELERKSTRELRALTETFDLLRNPSVATLKLRNSVQFRPRSNCHRCQNSFWFSMCMTDTHAHFSANNSPWYMSNNTIVDRVHFSHTAPSDFNSINYWVIANFFIQQLALAAIWTDIDQEKSVAAILSLVDYPSLIKLDNRGAPWVHRILNSREFNDEVRRTVEGISPEHYTMNKADTGSDVIEMLKSRIFDPATATHDIAAITKELTRREAERRRLFPQLGF